MGRAKETLGKKEVRNKQEKKRKDKAKRRLDKKEQGKKGSLDDMVAWVDENGVITSTPPDLTKKVEILAESIEIGVPKAKFRINNKIRAGNVKNFDESKGFGFIIDSDSKESIFVHANDCLESIKTGDKVEFETEKGIKGLKAVNVKPI
ncbi:MAG: cold shock domain-containing protein [Bacteroidales bacterium]|nr:cold shock domain-containing protein [Bacteroidales bacterium]